MKSSPLEEFHTERNARFVEDNGWRMPSEFGNPAAEYRAVRSRAGWLDLANRSVLSFNGPDALEWLQGMLSNDIKSLSPGEGTQAAVLNLQGKILADVRVLCTRDGFLIDLWESLKARVVAHLERYLVADEVEIRDCSEELTNISLQGPDTRRMLSLILETDRLPSHRLGHVSIPHQGTSVAVIAASHTGEDGFDLLLGRNHLRGFASVPAAAEICWIGLEAQNVLRLEAGIPRYGIDMDEDNLLLETNLDSAVSFTKGCYLGQEVVERIRSRGHVNKKLVGLKCSGDRIPERGDSIASEGGQDIGSITSATFSPQVKSPIALGYVTREHAVPGQPLVVQHAGEALPAVVAQLPFYERKDARPSERRASEN